MKANTRMNKIMWPPHLHALSHIRANLLGPLPIVQTFCWLKQLKHLYHVLFFVSWICVSFEFDIFQAESHRQLTPPHAESEPFLSQQQQQENSVNKIQEAPVTNNRAKAGDTSNMATDVIGDILGPCGKWQLKAILLIYLTKVSLSGLNFKQNLNSPNFSLDSVKLVHGLCNFHCTSSVPTWILL